MNFFMATESWTVERRVYVEARDIGEAARLLKRGGEFVAEEEADGTVVPGSVKRTPPVECERPTGQLRRI